MFNKDFFPTSHSTYLKMIEGFEVAGKVILEPSAGKGDLVGYMQDDNAKNVIACEINNDLRTILQTKCNVIEHDFLNLNSDKISHIDAIIMNPPFSAEEKHILHAFNIAPNGCQIISLCNYDSLIGTNTTYKNQIHSLIGNHGTFENLGQEFLDAERTTGVNIGLIKIKKPGQSYSTEFEGFFMDEEIQESHVDGLMPYNAVRDIVNRYIESIKIFDKQLDTAVQLNSLTSTFFSVRVGMSITNDNRAYQREEFKKDLQKSAWNWVIGKMNMTKYATRGLMDDINKFVEQQEKFPFTMKNIYKMLEIIIATTEQRMDKAILEVFDKLTSHYHENRYNVEGWKTNSHYLVNKRFIMPQSVAVGWSGEVSLATYGSWSHERIEDLIKALCYLEGKDYNKEISLYTRLRNRYFIADKEGNYIVPADKYEDAVREQEKRIGSKIIDSKVEFGGWFDWSFFKCKPFKKGTLHMEFKDADVWGRFNQRVAKIKGYPLYEGVKKQPKPEKAKEPIKPMKQTNHEVLFSVKV